MSIFVHTYIVVPPIIVEFEAVFTMASLTKLEKAAGIAVLSKLEGKKHEFQSIIRVKQHTVSGAINKWLTAPVLSRILPTWKNLLCVLRLINLDDLAKQVETYLSSHLPSTLHSEGVSFCLRVRLLLSSFILRY